MIAPNFIPSLLGDDCICIVGAGPVGLALGLALAKSQHRVLILEAGNDAGASAESESIGYDMVDPALHGAAALTTRSGLGGTSSAWGGGCTALDPQDFKSRAYVPDCITPVSFEEVVGYTNAASSFFGLGRAAFRDDVEYKDHSVDTSEIIKICPIPNMAKRYAGKLERCEKLVVSLNTRLLNLDFDPVAGRIINLEIQSAGQKYSIAPKLTVLCCGGVQTARLLLQLQRRNPHLMGGVNGPLGRYYMGHLSGSISRIRFNSPSAARRYLHLRSKGNHFQRHVLSLSPEVQTRHRLLASYFKLSSFPLSDPKHRNAALSMMHLGLCLGHGSQRYPKRYRTPHGGDAIVPRGDLRRHLRNLAADPISTLSGGARVAAWIARRRNLPGLSIYNPQGTYTLSYHGEHAPNPDSRVVLSDRRDQFGMRVAKVDLRFSDMDFESLQTSHELLRKWLRATGLGDLDYHGTTTSRYADLQSQAGDGYHQIGLTRMSDDVHSGVVDTNLAVHGIQNLFVAGCGVLPTSGKGHPTFPAVVFAMRLADHLTENYSRI